MTDVYAEIRAEREYQQGRWGNDTDDVKNTPWMFAAYIAQYATRWMAGTFAPLGPETTDAFRKSMVKVAAIAIAAVESLDRQRAAKGAAFYEQDQSHEG
jgi:hypothetical protein